MSVVLSVAAVLAMVLAIHEGGHFLVMRRLGVPIKGVGFGLNIGPSLRYRRKPTSEDPHPIEWRLHLIPIIAYVEPSAEGHRRIQELPYRDQTWVYNVGVIAGLATGYLFVAVSLLIDGHPAAAGIRAAIALAIWLLRRPLAAYLLPTVGAAVALAFIGWSVAVVFHELGVTKMGFIGFGETAAQIMQGNSSGLSSFFDLMGLVSLAIALVNMLPLFGLDNGRAVDLVLKHAGVSPRVRNVFQAFGVGAVAALMALTVGSDLLNLVP